MCPKRPGVLVLMFLLCFSAEAAVFDTLIHTPPGKRVSLARDIYKKEFRKTDSLVAFRGFDELFTIARRLGDRALECSIYELQADYFSVNRGFNKLSPSYYQKAINKAKEYDLAAETALYTYKKGSFYNTFRHYVEAYRYFLESYALFEAVGFDHVPDIANHLHAIANFHYTIHDYETARAILLEAVKYRPAVPRESVNMINTLALTYQNTGDDKTALRYFNEGLSIATFAADSAWMGIISGNIGAVFFRDRQYDKAIPRLRFDYGQSLRHGQLASAGTAIVTEAECHLAMGNVKEAERLLILAAPLAEKIDEPVLWIAYYNNMAAISEKKNDAKNALHYRKLYDIAKDSLEIINNQAAVNRVKLKWEMDKHVAEVDRLTAEASMEVLKRNSLIVVLFLLMIIAVLAYNRQMLKRRKDIEVFEKQEALLQSEKARTEEELLHATQALGLYTENLKHKNELIEEFKAEVEYLHLQLGEPPDREKIRNLEKLTQAHIMTDENWDEFKKLFDKVHAGFIFRLREKFSHATETDIRLLTLIKLGLGNREMANMLGVSADAIKKSRQRLRKKINLPEDQRLEDVVVLI